MACKAFSGFLKPSPALLCLIIAAGTMFPANGQVTLENTAEQADFSIIADPASIGVVLGSSNSSILTLTSLNGFSGQVDLAATIDPLVSSGPKVSLEKSRVNLTAGETETVNVTVTDTEGVSALTFTVTVSGDSRSISHSTSISVRQMDFNISVGPNSHIVYPGLWVGFRLLLFSVNGFSGGIRLNGQVSPSLQGSPTVSFQPSQTNVAPDGVSGSDVRVSTGDNAPDGTYSVTVTATSGTRVKTISVTVIVDSTVIPDFHIETTYDAVTIQQGTSMSLTISMFSWYGFSAEIQLSVAVSTPTPQGPSVTLSNNIVYLPGGGYGASFMTISAGYSTLTGGHNVIVTGAGGGVSHSFQLGIDIIQGVDFSLSVPSSIQVNPGRSASLTITAYPVNRFIGGINLTASIPPEIKGLILVELEPSFVVITPLSPGVATINILASPELGPMEFILNITGTSGPISHTVQVNVRVVLHAIARFTYSPVPPLLGGEAVFDGSNSFSPEGSIALYQWHLGDGTYAQGKTVVHVYAQMGTYEVRLTITDTQGLIDTTTQYVYVSTHPYTPGVRPGMTASYLATAQNGSSTFSATFEVTVLDVQGTNVTLSVDVFEGNIRVNSTTVWADVASGQMSTPLLPFFLVAKGLVPEDSLYAAGLFQVFKVQISNNTNLLGTMRTVNHLRYDIPGTSFLGAWDRETGMLAFISAVVVLGQNQFSATYRLTRTNAWKSLSAEFSSASVASLRLNFTSRVEGGQPPYAYDWSFGDGSTSSVANPSHAYGRPGNYTVRLLVGDLAGNSRTLEVVVNVAVPPSDVPFLDIRSILSGRGLMYAAAVWLAVLGITVVGVLREERRRKRFASEKGIGS